MKQTAIFLVAYVVLIFVHLPSLLLHGRIWAEEGPVYLRGGWSGNVFTDLVAPHLGYLAVWPNLCGILAARLFPLQDAALLLTWCALAIQLLTGYVVLQCELLTTLRTRVLALLVLLFASSFEVWLNTINSQFYLVICAAVILLSNPARHKLFRNFVLALAAFTGPMSLVFVPWYLFRAALEKIRPAITQAVVFTSCSLVQLIATGTQLTAHVRQTNFQPSGIAPEYLVRYILRPFGSRLLESAGSALILNQFNQFWAQKLHFHFTLHWPALLLWTLLDLAWIALLFWITSDSSDRSPWWLLTMAIAIALFSMYGAVGGTYQLEERYAFASSVLVA